MGFVPYDELPRVKNPARGFLATANNRVTPPSYPHPTPGRYSLYRAERLFEALPAGAPHDIESFSSLQNDVSSTLARDLLVAIRRSRPQTPSGRAAQARLDSWDGVLRAEGPEALIYATWFRAVHRRLFADELGAAWRPEAKPVLLEAALLGAEGRWCDDQSTPNRESCSEVVGRALDDAAAELEAAHGADMATWSWGAVHQAVYAHRLLGRIPGLG
ncbi:MAG: penicillin acylase family protein, partial [Myxococcota bacterium]